MTVFANNNPPKQRDLANQRVEIAPGNNDPFKFQGLLFPEGLPFDGSAFGTAKTSPVFSYLRSVSDTESKMASPRRFELRLPA